MALGPVELASAGASIALFNQALKISVAPLVSITTSFVAEEDTKEKINTIEAEKQFNESVKAKSNGINSNDHLPQDIKLENSETPTEAFAANGEKNDAFAVPQNVDKEVGSKKRHLASASTALLFGTILGLLQATILISAAKPLLGVIGLKHGSPMLFPAIKYLRLRALGSPAVLLFLVMQGIFRGFKDTKTPLYVIVAGYTFNVALDPLLIFYCKLGIQGAAISHVISQYIMALALLLLLMKKMILLPPSIKNLQISKFLKNGGLVLARIVAATFCVTLSASFAARLGPIEMAAFQTCLQVWLTSSLLADGLAVAGQAILACSFAEKDYEKLTAASARTVQFGIVLGLGLSLVVGIGLYFGAGIFSKSILVVNLIRIGVPFVAATQPINSLAFVFDGVLSGASDFAYSGYSLASSHDFILFCRNFSLYVSLSILILSKFCTFSGHSVITKCCSTVPSLQETWFCWDLDWINHLYESSHVCWCMEAGNRNRTMAIP
ncbi:PREDICTED: protein DETOXIFICATION 43-like isoform X2 [Lupinus angustifolius]|uniref:protein DETOXIFICATION 43-like isoform X2 n=1 Tax=Lupinus angustifolius TaxID=3871 RepID=UPI00092FBFF7|nr:PREDICTED: protein DETOXIFICATION 43-like isoform X2 [Lupinus angustifolius]